MFYFSIILLALKMGSCDYKNAIHLMLNYQFTIQSLLDNSSFNLKYINTNKSFLNNEAFICGKSILSTLLKVFQL